MLSCDTNNDCYGFIVWDYYNQNIQLSLWAIQVGLILKYNPCRQDVMWQAGNVWTGYGFQVIKYIQVR
jgi:hypothetical protein